jgi:hypothetical protein
VLVVTNESSSNYLMGYIPTYNNQGTQDFQTTGMVEEDGRGQVFRYKQTGKKTAPAGEEYSEIGFYHEETAWKAKAANAASYADIPADTNDYPHIDRINIHSTGDIHESAVNHHQIQAKRFELFVDCDPPTEPGDYESNKLFGDRPGDDSTLYAGDAHIRAKNRIVIKAGESIELQAGRSSIIINDEGITIASRKTQSNLYNGWDSLMVVKASKGISMFGQHIEIRGGIDFKLMEGYGGTISSKLGVMRLAGFDVRVQHINTFNYLGLGVGNGIDFLANCGTMIAGAAGANSGIGKSLSNMSVGERAAVPFFASQANSSIAGGEQDVADSILRIIDIILTVSLVVEGVLGRAIPKKLLRDEHGRDGLYTALALAEYGVLLGAFYALCSPRMIDPFYESTIELSGGIICMEGVDLLKLFRDERSAQGPLAGVDSKSLKDAYKDGFNNFLSKLQTALADKKLVAGIAAGIGAAAVGSIGYGVYASKIQDEEFEAELRSL